MPSAFDFSVYGGGGLGGEGGGRCWSDGSGVTRACCISIGTRKAGCVYSPDPSIRGPEAGGSLELTGYQPGKEIGAPS